MVLLEVIRKTKLKEKQMRLLMLGLDNSGKTTIVKYLMNEDVNTVSPTFGFSIKTMKYKNYNLHIWDVGGQKSLRPFWRNYYEETDGLLWIIDSSDMQRINDCKTELYKLLGEERLSGATLLLLANKQDVEGTLSTDMMYELLELQNLKNRSWKLQPCSAIAGYGISDAIDWVVEDIAKRIYMIQ